MIVPTMMLQYGTNPGSVAAAADAASVAAPPNDAIMGPKKPNPLRNKHPGAMRVDAPLLASFQSNSPNTVRDEEATGAEMTRRRNLNQT